FGMQMPGRSNSYGAGVEYRYAYNGMELDNEVSGNGNSYTTEFRQYDPRLGRWKSLDPLMVKFPWMSPYVAFNNNPILFTDPLGLESEVEGGGNPHDYGVDPDEGSEHADAPKIDPMLNESTTTPQIQKKPSYKDGQDVTTYDWDKLYDNYDRDGTGILEDNKCFSWVENKESVNTCAIKLSNTLNKSGYPIPTSKETPPDVRIQDGAKGDGGNFVLDAKSMANYLTDIEPPTETYKVKTSEGVDKMIENIHKLYDDMYGIIVYVADDPATYGATGHADLIYEDWGWDLAFSSGTEVGPYLKDHVLPQTTFTVYIWIMGYDK
ncbi:MAG: T6SS effector amidase Tae4 family protein, partial [Bacteroidota bacterium]